MTLFKSLGIPEQDEMFITHTFWWRGSKRACDVLFTKPGYGAFTEAACNGTRVLYVERDDWPEEPWLSRWLMEHGNGVKINRRQLATGELAEPLRALRVQPAKPPVAPTGAAEAAGWLERLLR